MYRFVVKRKAMPIYEYACSKCQARFELLVRQDSVVCCPECSAQNPERLLSLPAAPQGASKSLPVTAPHAGGGCGLPQCGRGRCQFD
jgi:putative FmdB family regulatory protein